MSDGRFHSGQALAHEFNLSRSSIFNALAQAESMGLTIHAVRGRGYRMPEPVEWLDGVTVADYLGTVAEAYTIHVLDSVDSTNTTLMAAALNGAVDGTLICTEHQQSGKGRRGRQWHSVLGGSLTFSVLWRFENGLQSLSGLSLAVGLAIARAVNRHSRHPVRLKWPNDVLVDYRKLAGILVEVQGDMHGAAFAVVGVGLNVRLSGAQRDAVDQAVVDLAEMGVVVGRNRLLADCLLELHAVLSLFRQHGFASLREDWLKLDAYAGRAVALALPDARSVRGMASGVDETGAFLLRDAQATLRPYSGGEISLRLDAA
ncbi:MAG: biotin--[acetyl-CoA-carboxylase] ligase [Thiobacillus sp.]|nr:biotin--[acetyl-CoA-carboxylase] ligase [Thiobacillus sp.]MDP2252759.1 biotin--[acetyl-CoA-carboxylase] ligase [Thiobacillus sp.]